MVAFWLIIASPGVSDQTVESIEEFPITAADRQRWSLRPVQKPAIPSVHKTSWPRNGIDFFVLARMEQEGVAPAPPADRAALLRRLCFDLTGLPPRPHMLGDFQEDRSPGAYERLVDRLLGSPAWGERWGQHWLDLARFADTDGFELDHVRPDAWRYRDWVIAGLNADMPYDRFVRLQLAGDQLEEGAHSVATMFCLAGPDMPDINDQTERRHSLMNEMTATVGAVLLGLQVGCAQCHDHKFDPISQADFYRLRAIFEGAVPPLKRDVSQPLLASYDDPLVARLWIRGDHRRPGPRVSPAVPRAAAAEGQSTSLADSEQPRIDFADWLFCGDNPLTARVIVNRLWQQSFGRGIFATPSDVGLMGSEPSHPELLDYLAVELREHGWSLKHLQRMIVCSATYRQASFGEAGEGDWQRSLEVDPANELLSRFPRRRMEGESLRDAMLAAAGLLSAERGGPGVMPPLPEELQITLLKGQWSTSERRADHFRRSIYLFARRNLRYPIFEAFDRPDANASCPMRNRTTTALQSLMQLNSDFSLLAARYLAGRIQGQASDPAEQITLLYRYALSRAPAEAEVNRLTSFLVEQRRRLVDEGRSADQLALPAGGPPSEDPHASAALVDACLAVMNSSEFLYID